MGEGLTAFSPLSHADGGNWRKQIYAESLARELRLPMIRLIDGASGGGSGAVFSVSLAFFLLSFSLPLLSATGHALEVSGRSFSFGSI